MSCRDCKYLDVPLSRTGRRIIRANSVYRCTFPTQDIVFPPVPSSLLKYGVVYPPHTGIGLYTCADYGKDCATFVKREAKP